MGVYARILLASDGTREGLAALREGALAARAFGAEVYLLIIEREPFAIKVADGIHPLPVRAHLAPLLDQGLARLRRLGLRASGTVEAGEPAAVIAAHARGFRADLVMVGHRRQSLLDRWWSGSSGAYLVDSVGCSVLVCRTQVSDAEFEAQIGALA